jgi:8-oxo-dGTP diphosphatase
MNGTTNFMEPQAWHSSLAGVIVAAGALIRDAASRVLCVKPNYRDYWTLPGGICEAGEPPHAACAREVREEVGLDVEIARLLTVDWQPPSPEYGSRARPTLYFVFDGGVLADGTPIVLQHEELDDYQFAAPDELVALLAPPGLRRAEAALAATAVPGASYLPLRRS